MPIWVANYLKGVDVFGKDCVTHNLGQGIIDFFNWGFLNIGAFSTVQRTISSGVYGGARYRLRPVKDPRFTDGQVWEGFRGNWVWETGVTSSMKPIKASGVWVNGTYQTSNNSSSYIDYTRGRVVFTTPIATTSIVDTEFSHRLVSFKDIEEPEIQRLMYDSWRVDRSDALNASSGNWSTLADTRIQLPCVAIEVCYDTAYTPLQIGGGQYINKTINFYIFAENKEHKDYITDIIAGQNDRCIYIPDRFLMRKDSRYPLNVDFKGAVTGVAKLEYLDLVKATGDGGFCWQSAYISNTRVENLQPINGWLHRSRISAIYSITSEDI